MFKNVDGEKIPLTQEEIQQLEEEQKRYEEELKKQPPSQEDRIKALESAMLSMMGGM